MQITDWTDFGLFASVARAGSLAGAARETGLSQAPLSRRMTALEQRTGRCLFRHGAAGYTPTAEGRARGRVVRPTFAGDAMPDRTGRGAAPFGPLAGGHPNPYL